MREILFRGKCIRTDKWVYGYLSNSDVINTYKGRLKVHKETIGQYTGLKDKNGVKIFEGDYLHMPGYYCEVVFIDGGFHTVYNHPEDGETLPILDLDLCKMEVIGNIHDK